VPGSSVDAEGLEDTLEILSQPGALDEIEKARAEIEGGAYVSAAELEAKYRRG
jgi:hypothetical protein